MKNLTYYNDFISTENSLNNHIIQFFKNHKWLRFYTDGKVHFLFFVRGKFYCFSELQVTLFLSFVTYSLIFGIRVLMDKFKIKQKTTDFIRNLRRGHAAELNYEDVSSVDSELFNIYNDILLISDPNRGYIEGMLTKCLEVGKIYRITNTDIINILKRMIRFSKKDSFQSVSFEVFVLAVVVSLKSSTQVTGSGLYSLIKRLTSNTVMEYSPVFLTIISSGFFAFQLQGPLTMLNFLLGSINMLGSSFLSFKVFEQSRNMFIECGDYVKEMPSIKRENAVESLTKKNREIETGLVPYKEPISCNGEGEFSYTREVPDKYVMYVEAEGTESKEFCYQIDPDNNNNSDIEIPTLGGIWRKFKELNGKEKLGIVKSKKEKILKSKYIPLKKRTKTLKDLWKMDSTQDRSRAKEIIKSVRIQQRRGEMATQASDFARKQLAKLREKIPI